MSWYKAGSIAVSGVTVTGTGTNWTDNKQGIGPGQALLIPGSGTVKMYEILRVDSATKLTLTSDAGAIASGQAYAIMSFYADSVPDFSRRLSAQLSYYQSQMDNLQLLMTGAGTVTITDPNGKVFSGPAWGGIAGYIDAVCPVGMRLDWPSLVLPDAPALGVKYLRLNGATFSKTLYPKLGAIYTSGVLPDMRGDTVRGYDDGRGIDQGRALLSEQADAIQNITGSMDLRPIISNGQPYANRLRSSGAFGGTQPAEGNLGNLAGQQSATTVTTLVESISFDASRIVRTSTETRMRNMAWNMIVRAS
jgi:hypothetical protein